MIIKIVNPVLKKKITTEFKFYSNIKIVEC